jgi:hypothetical protein
VPGHPRATEPVFSRELDLWVVTRHADALAVLMDYGRFSSAGALRGSTEALPHEVQTVLAGAPPDRRS